MRAGTPSPEDPGVSLGGSDPRAFVVGVDGGGSGSRALAVDLTGRELANASGPPGLVDLLNPEALSETLASTVGEAVAQAGLQLPARCLWAGLAGAGLADTREVVEAALEPLGLADRIQVGMDLEGAHRDAFAGGQGVVLAVGTGTMVWGRGPGGKEVRVGGWGSQLGEEGSGYWFGMEGLRAVARAWDQRDPPTLLTSSLLGSLGFGEAQDLLPWIQRASKAQVAAMAPLVLEAAAQGDSAALAIRTTGLEALERHLGVIRKAWAPWGATFPLALTGGLLREGGPLRAAVAELGSGMGGIIHPDPVVPVRGAARLALELAVEVPPSR